MEAISVRIRGKVVRFGVIFNPKLRRNCATRPSCFPAKKNAGRVLLPRLARVRSQGVGIPSPDVFGASSRHDLIGGTKHSWALFSGMASALNHFHASANFEVDLCKTLLPQDPKIHTTKVLRIGGVRVPLSYSEIRSYAPLK